jgi:LicD family
MASVSRPPCTQDTSRCAWWTWGAAALRPQCCTEHLLELIGFTSDLLARHGIAHWLDWGALLGVVREGRLIPWDADVDFGILQRDEEAVLALEDEVAAAGHHLERPGLWRGHRGVICIRYSKLNRANLDLIIWQARDGMVSPLKGSAEGWPGMSGRIVFPERFIAPPGEVSLNGQRLPAPAPVEEFLREHRYGPDWGTPAPPMKSMKYYPSFDIAATTPEIQGLLERIAAGEQRLSQSSESGRSRGRAGELWAKSGLPIHPDARRMEAVLSQSPGGSPPATVQGLARSVAVLEQAIEEFEHPSASLALRKVGRRIRRAAEVLLARARRRPHRAGFPFGV